MNDISIRIEGCAGRITLQRPEALNALTYAICLEIDAALSDWATNADVALVLIDAEGDRAFCAGGDIGELYGRVQAGDADFGPRFWRHEYRMNARIFDYPKPVVSFLHGFVMGGGVGLGCHGKFRIVSESSRIAMPECGIGLVPDVGGTLILATAPGRSGEFLGTTGFRMGPADAIYAGFADFFIAQSRWPEIKQAIIGSGSVGVLLDAASDPPPGQLTKMQQDIDACFAGDTLGDILRALSNHGSQFAHDTLALISRHSPLSMACTVEAIHRVRSVPDIGRALEIEFRFTRRSIEASDFLEGVRAMVIDKDHAPRWRHNLEHIPQAEAIAMLLPLGEERLRFEEE